MQACIEETNRRRVIQIEYNKKHGITPTTIRKNISQGLREIYGLSKGNEGMFEDITHGLIKKYSLKTGRDIEKIIKSQTKLMKKAAGALDFETAAQIKLENKRLRELLLKFGGLDD